MTDNKLNIALIGYGKMGKIIEKVAKDRGHHIALTISSKNREDFIPSSLEKIDVAIEFTTPHSAAANLLFLAKHGIPAVSGTTGWLDKYKEISTAFQNTKTGFLYASNFSIGVNVLFALNKQLAKLMAQHSEYEVSMQEAHHITKKDAPSGTAVTLAGQIMENIERKKSWSISENEVDNIFIEVIREKDVKGMHEISYSSDIDTITLKHEAHSREGFALGAVLAAEYIRDKKGIYTMSDVLAI